jgi:hypothetical protein
VRIERNAERSNSCALESEIRVGEPVYTGGCKGFGEHGGRSSSPFEDDLIDFRLLFLGPP